MEIVVRQGDSLWHFSQMFQVNLQLVNDSNPKIDPNNLSVGQKVRIPGFVAKEYQIQQGDSLWSIAKQMNLPLEAMELTNPELDPSNLSPGRIIKVPSRINWRLVQSGQKYDYSNLLKDINRLKEIYPFLQVSNIGKTVLGRDIPEIMVGTGEKRFIIMVPFMPMNGLLPWPL